MTIPLSEPIVIAVARLIDDSMVEPKREPPQQTLDRALFEAGCAINRLRNKEGTGHGRPWPVTVTDAEAREATELMGIIAARLLLALERSR